MLVGMGPTCFGVRVFVGRSFAVLPPLLFLLRISAALQMIRDPNLCAFLVRKELRNQWEVIGVVLSL